MPRRYWTDGWSAGAAIAGEVVPVTSPATEAVPAACKKWRRFTPGIANLLAAGRGDSAAFCERPLNTVMMHNHGQKATLSHRPLARWQPFRFGGSGDPG